MALKSFDLAIEVSAKGRKPTNTGVVFESYDKNSLIFNVTLTSDYEPISITTNDVLKVSVVKVSNPSQKIVLNLPAMSGTSIAWEPPEALLGYDGKVRVGFYLKRPNEQVSAGYFYFKSQTSDIDSNIEEMTENVLGSLDDFEAELDALILQAEAKMVGVDQAVEEMEQAIQQAQEDIAGLDTDIGNAVDAILNELNTSKTNAQGQMTAKVSEVETSKTTAQGQMTSKVSDVETARQTAQTNINTKVTQVETAKTNAITTINNYAQQVSQTELVELINKVDALDELPDLVAGNVIGKVSESSVMGDTPYIVDYPHDVRTLPTMYVIAVEKQNVATDPTLPPEKIVEHYYLFRIEVKNNNGVVLKEGTFDMKSILTSTNSIIFGSRYAHESGIGRGTRIEFINNKWVVVESYVSVVPYLSKISEKGNIEKYSMSLSGYNYFQSDCLPSLSNQENKDTDSEWKEGILINSDYLYLDKARGITNRNTLTNYIDNYPNFKFYGTGAIKTKEIPTDNLFDATWLGKYGISSLKGRFMINRISGYGGVVRQGEYPFAGKTYTEKWYELIYPNRLLVTSQYVKKLENAIIALGGTIV